jgi:alkylmercury lyase
MNRENVERSSPATIRHLAVAWQEAEVLLPLFPLLARGEPLAIDRASQATGVPAAEIERAAAAGRCERDAQGRLVDLYGMTLAPTLHRIEVESKIVYSCCALWAHVIPRLIGQRIEVQSVDPVRRELVRLSIDPTGVEAVEPFGARATMVVSSDEEVSDDVRASFCHQVSHFVSPESAREFAEESSERAVFELDQFQDAADQLYRAIWSAVHSRPT